MTLVLTALATILLVAFAECKVRENVTDMIQETSFVQHALYSACMSVHQDYPLLMNVFILITCLLDDVSIL